LAQVDARILVARILPPRPPVPTEAEQHLRETNPREWTPVFVVLMDGRLTVADGVRRVREARHRGLEHVLTIEGERGKSLLKQYERLGLPITDRTRTTWAKRKASADG
jgi:hypothetical protein